MKTVTHFSSLLTRLRNGEHYVFFQVIVQFGQTYIAGMSELRKLLNAIVRLFEKESKIYKYNPKSPITASLNEVNRQRIDARMLVLRQIEAASYSPHPAVKEAAKALAWILDNYKGVNHASMVEMSAMLDNMVSDFRLPRYAGAVATLSLGEAIDSLEEVNNNFIALYQKRTHSIGAIHRLGFMADIRPKIDQAFALFVEALNALLAISLLEGNTATANACQELINRINETIANFERIYTRRSGRNVSGRIKAPAVPHTDEQS
ncbi:MAG: DUF6261 family protein [Tannerellaceae bacterium]|jgi:tetratricopeptide (TPR) repeat protein|nr:DUF6261 family protein [Tannerellaceae bacterium]